MATDAPVTMTLGLLQAMLSAVIFIDILWNVGGDLTVTVFGHVLTVPKYLVIAVVVYSALLTLAMLREAYRSLSRSLTEGVVATTCSVEHVG